MQTPIIVSLVFYFFSNAYSGLNYPVIFTKIIAQTISYGKKYYLSPINFHAFINFTNFINLTNFFP
jgi:hypothetical protein